MFKFAELDNLFTQDNRAPPWRVNSRKPIMYISQRYSRPIEFSSASLESVWARVSIIRIGRRVFRCCDREMANNTIWLGVVTALILSSRFPASQLGAGVVRPLFISNRVVVSVQPDLDYRSTEYQECKILTLVNV